MTRVCCIKNQGLGEKRGHSWEGSESFSDICQHITSLESGLWLASSLLNPPAPCTESAYFPNNSSTDQSDLVKLFQVCNAGGYYNHKGNGNIKTCLFAQCPDESHSLSVSLQPINSWACQSNRESCGQTPRASLRWMERYMIFSLFCSSNVFKKEKKKKKPESIYNKINAWQVTE